LSKSDIVVQTKYTTVTIPVRLFARIQRIIKKNDDFKSVADYVAFVLREIVINHGLSDSSDSFNNSDLEQLKNRLRALGSL